MASIGGSGLELWLRELLDSYGADGEVFGEYISGTLNTMEDSPEDEIYESLLEILQGCVVSWLLMCVVCMYVGSTICYCAGK